MGLSLAQLRTEVLRECGLDATDLDPGGGTEILDLLINQSWWEVQDKLGFDEKEDDTDVETVAGTFEYNLSTVIFAADAVIFEALQKVFILNPDTGKKVELIETSNSKWEEEHTTEITSRGIPTHYMRRGGIIRLSPVPDAVYTLTLYHLITLSDIPSAGPQVPQSWHEIIKYGAVWRGHHSYRDYNSAREVKQTQMGLIASAQTTSGKEDASKKMYGVEVPTRPSGRRY